MNYCLYHASCPDGFAAALAVWQKYGDDFQYIEVQYNNPPPEMEEIDRLFIVDFSYPNEVINQLESRSNQLTIIDHHDGIDNISFIKRNSRLIYDQDHSGAVLTYQFLNPYQPIPLFFQYIEDRDLWKWQLPNSRAFSAGLDIRGRTFEEWDEIVEEEYLIESVINEGSIVLEFINQKVKSLAEKAVLLKDQSGLTYATINSPLFQSEIGEYLCKNKDIDYADIYFLIDSEPRKIVHSLRSRGRANVTDIAKSKGGGGHPSGRTAGYNEELK